MADLDTRPETVDIAHYAGDTLAVNVKVAAAYVAGRTWSAQIRSSRTATTPDATFTITENADGATLVLPAAEARRLAGLGVVARTETRNEVRRYTGVWDVQLAPTGGGDPTNTLAQGEITIDLDVTRTP